MPEDVRRFPLGPGLNLMNYHLSFVFRFSFPLESLLLKGYCDERYTRRSWRPRLIAETSGKSQENSRVTWETYLSNADVEFPLDLLPYKQGAFIFRASWTVLRRCCSWGPCEKSQVDQPVCSMCQLPFDHTHPQDVDSLLQIFSCRLPFFLSFFFLLSCPFSPGPRISAFIQLSLDQYQL